jgi:hypothetical protein
MTSAYVTYSLGATSFSEASAALAAFVSMDSCMPAFWRSTSTSWAKRGAARPELNTARTARGINRGRFWLDMALRDSLIETCDHRKKIQMSSSGY